MECRPILCNGKLVTHRYSIDLPALHASCESSYVRLLKLFPDYATSNVREFQLWGGCRVRFEVVERCRYTTLLKAWQLAPAGTDATLVDTPWLLPLYFELRMYHDADMAEVTGFQSTARRPGRHSSRHIAARYEYPNPAMYAPDEKAQRNVFLAEWLRHCLLCGETSSAVSSAAAVTAADR